MIFHDQQEDKNKKDYFVYTLDDECKYFLYK